MIGAGQHIWIRMWNDNAEGNEQIVVDGCLEPGADIHLTFADGPQTITRFALTRITHEDAEALAAQKGVKQML